MGERNRVYFCCYCNLHAGTLVKLTCCLWDRHPYGVDPVGDGHYADAVVSARQQVAHREHGVLDQSFNQSINNGEII